MKQAPSLRTKRLLLRPLQLADAKAVQQLAADKAIADTTSNIPHPYLDGVAEEWINIQQLDFEAGLAVNFAIVQQDNNRLNGAIGLMNLSAEHQRGELGYWVGKPYWGKGYCTEAARAVVHYGFAELQLNRIFARVFKRNLASARVMEKTGLTKEGCLRSHDKKWQQFEDIVLYGMLKSDQRRP